MLIDGETILTDNCMYRRGRKGGFTTNALLVFGSHPFK